MIRDDLPLCSLVVLRMALSFVSSFVFVCPARRAVELLRALASGHAVSISEVPQEQMRTLRKVKQPPMRSMRLLAPTVQSELLA